MIWAKCSLFEALDLVCKRNALCASCKGFGPLVFLLFGVQVRLQTDFTGFGDQGAASGPEGPGAFRQELEPVVVACRSGSPQFLVR